MRTAGVMPADWSGCASTGCQPARRAARALAVPGDTDDPGKYIPGYVRFCSTFPDTFVVTERARVFLDPKVDKDNVGRLLSAGFHSMTGYFRDDAPLYDLILDERAQRELDELWLDFDCITGAPMRQYSSFLWFERAESRFMAAAEFDFARAEDKSAASEAMIERLAKVYLAKARRNRASETAIQAVEDYFKIISANIRRVERTRLAAEPSHVEALQAFAERAFRRPLSPSERDGVVAFYRTLREKDGLSHEDAVRDSIVSILMSPHFCYRVDLPGAGSGVLPLSDYDLASRLSYFLWASMPDAELLARAAAGDLHRPEVLVKQARRMLRDVRVRGLATEFGGNWLDFRRFEEHNSVDRTRFKTFNDELRRSMFEEPVRFFIDVVYNDRSVREFLDGKIHVRQSEPRPALRHARAQGRQGRMGARRRRERLRARGALAHGGVPDQEFARLADQPGQARLLGRAALARRDHSGAASQRTRAA